MLLLVWLPLIIPIYWVVSDRNTINLLTLPLLYGEFILLVRFWGRRVYQEPNLLSRYGLRFSRQNGRELCIGLAIGISSVSFLFVLQGALGWLTWQPSLRFLPGLILEGLAIGLAFGFVEELLFRGWLLDELQRDYRPTIVLWVGAIVFACLHFIRPLPEIIRMLPAFPSLLVLGLTLIWAKRSCFTWQNGQRWERLGLPIGVHAGLVGGNYVIEVGRLVEYANRSPTWLTGMDRNPLAGVMGLFFLGVLALSMSQFAAMQRKQKTMKGEG